MKSVVETDTCKMIVEGATIRVVGKIPDESDNNRGKVKFGQCKIGVVSILPKVQIVLGCKLDSFMEALELSRIPLALNKTLERGSYCTYDVVRLMTGNIKEATIATISVYFGIVIGVTYSRSILIDKQFRRLVKLSAMHQISICDREDKARLLKATACISTLTGISREKLTVIETARNIKVRVKFGSHLGLPLFYTFALDKTNRYNLLQIAFDFNEVAKSLKEKAEVES